MPRLLDTFCKAGGCSMGYYRAGFEVVGVDIEPQPRYPFPFIQADALEFIAMRGREFDAIHASPPCQGYSDAKTINRETYGQHPDLIGPCRDALCRIGRPWVIENVRGAPLFSPVMLCGKMFGLKTYRHRYFETSFFLFAPAHHPHKERCPRAGRGATESGLISVVGNIANMSAARQAMGIDWMTRAELTQAIPPAYTEFIGRQLLDRIAAPGPPE